MFRAAVPSGASTGIYEAVELRDGDKAKYEPSLPSPHVFHAVSVKVHFAFHLSGCMSAS